MKFGIDLSHHNKIFDYEKAFANKDFIIIRAGFGKSKNHSFTRQTPLPLCTKICRCCRGKLFQRNCGSALNAYSNCEHRYSPKRQNGIKIRIKLRKQCRRNKCRYPFCTVSRRARICTHSGKPLFSA